MRSLAAICLCIVIACLRTNGGDLNWPQFRGPGGLGIAQGNPPTEFAVDQNVVWQTPLPQGSSSPILWGDRIFLTGKKGNRLETICLESASGKIVWEREAPAEKIEPFHPTGSAASPTPVTDGERVYVYFGSFGLLAYDFNGEEKWRLKLPPPIVEFGASASPILANGKLILVCDQDLDSYLLALDPRTGRELWKTDRSEFRRSFATPFHWRHIYGEELVVPGSIWLRSYNLENGKELWSYEGTSRVACSSATGNSNNFNQR